MALQNQLDEWLKKALLWQEESNFESVSHQITSYDNLIIFLRELYEEFCKMGSVECVIGAYPNVGQLLGRLMSLPALLVHRPLHHTLLKCLLTFFTEEPTNPVETRAKTWVLSLLRSSVSTSADGLQTFGFTQHKFYMVCLKKVIEVLSYDFTSDMARIKSVTMICLNLCHVPQFSDILDQIVQQIVRGKLNMNDGGKWLMEELANSQQHPYTGDGVTSLSSVTSLALYQANLQALEHEVLDLIEAMRRRRPPQRRTWLTKTLQRRQLPWCCAHSSAVYLAVCNLLRALWNASGHLAVAMVAAGITSLVRIHARQLCLSLDSHFPASLQSEIHLLTYKPKELSLEACGQMVIFLSQTAVSHQMVSSQSPQPVVFVPLVVGPREEDNANREWLWILFPDWRVTIATVHFLCHNPQVTQSSCYLLHKAMCQASTGTPQVTTTSVNEDVLHDMLESLTCLQRRTTSLVTKHHLQCAIPTQCQHRTHALIGPQQVTSSVIGQLLITFLLCVDNVDAAGIDFIMQMIIDPDKPLSSATSILDLIEEILEHCPQAVVDQVSKGVPQVITYLKERYNIPPPIADVVAIDCLDERMSECKSGAHQNYESTVKCDQNNDSEISLVHSWIDELMKVMKMTLS